MVFDKLKQVFSSNDEKYEILYYKYSKIKLENQKLKEENIKNMNEHKKDVHEKIARHLIGLYEGIEIAKNDSFKVKANDKDLQRLLIDVNKIEKDIKKVMQEYSLEEISASERYYDPEIHSVASYEDAKGMAKGLIIKTVKKGFKFKGETIIKPKVLVTK